MSTMVTELYDALRQAGVDEQVAKDAATAVMNGRDLVTKAHLRAELAELTAELIKWNVGTLVALAAIFSAIVKWTP